MLQDLPCSDSVCVASLKTNIFVLLCNYIFGALCGSNRLHHWPTLISAVEYVNRVADLFKPYNWDISGQSSGYHDTISLDRLRGQIRDEGSVDEESLFLLGRICEATDFRDRTFGLVGLADQKTREVIVPDYGLAGGNLFGMAAKHLLTRSESLDCLSVSQGCLKMSDLLSWVTDFSEDWPHVARRYKEGQENVYCASVTTSPEVAFLT